MGAVVDHRHVDVPAARIVLERHRRHDAVVGHGSRHPDGIGGARRVGRVGGAADRGRIVQFELSARRHVAACEGGVIQRIALDLEDGVVLVTSDVQRGFLALGEDPGVHLGADVVPNRLSRRGHFEELAVRAVADQGVAVGQTLGARDGFLKHVRRRVRHVGPRQRRRIIGLTGGQQVVPVLVHRRHDLIHARVIAAQPVVVN